MPTDVIRFGNQQATGDSSLAGAPGLAYNVVVDGAGAVRRRPGIVAWDGFPGVAAYAASDSTHLDLFENMHVRAISSFGDKPVWFSGIATFDGVNYFQDWWSLTDAGALDRISGNAGGGITGAERPVFAQTQFRIVAVAGGSAINAGGSYWDGVAALGTFWSSTGGSSGLGPYATQVVALAQRLLANDNFSATANNRVLYTGVGSTGNLSFGTLAFFSAEARPDAVVALRENSNELFVFGERSLQIYSPDPQFIFAPGRTVNRGCAAVHSVVQADETYFWLDEQRQFVLSDGRSLEVTSDPIAADLDSIVDVSDCYGFRVNTGQFDVLVQQFPTDGRAFAYQNGSGWSQWSTWNEDTNQHGPFNIKSHYYWPEENLHLVGMEDGSIAQLSTSAHTDLGVPIKAEVTTGFINHGTDAKKFTDALHLTFKRGRSSSTEPQVLLSWRDADGAAFGSPRRIGLGTTGDYVSTVTLRTLGGYRRRQWKLEFSGDTELVLASVSEDFTVGGS